MHESPRVNRPRILLVSAPAALKLGSSSRQGLARSLDCHRAALTAGELTIEQGPRYVIIANARQRSLTATAAWSTLHIPPLFSTTFLAR